MQTLQAIEHVQALRRRPDAHKGDAGKVLLVGGAASMAGALGVQLHAMAGDTLAQQGAGPVGMTPSELAQEIRAEINAQLQ